MNIHDNIMYFIETKLDIDPTHNEYKKFTQLITLANIAYLKTAIYTFSKYLQDKDFEIDSKFDFLMKIYNKLLKEHQVLFLLFNLFETSLRSKLAYTLSKKYSSQNKDDWLHKEELIPTKIEKPLEKIKRYISDDSASFENMNSYEIFDYMVFGDLKDLYYDFWSDVSHLFQTKNYKGHQLQEIGRIRLREMLNAIRKARNDIAHHKPLQKGRKKRYKLIEDIEHILLHLGFNLDDAINNIDPQHKIIKIGFYEKANKVSKLLKNPSKKNLKEIRKLTQYRGVDKFFQKELLKSDLLGWYDVLKKENYFKSSSFPLPTADNHLPFWRALDFLEQLGKNFKKSDYLDIEKEIVAILDDFIAYLQEMTDKNIIINHYNDWIVFQIIQKFQVSNFKLEHIDFIRAFLSRDNSVAFQIRKNFIKKIYLCNTDINISFLNMILEYQVLPSEYNKIKPLIDDYNINEFFVFYKELVDDRHFSSIINILLKKIEELNSINQYSNISLRSIEESSQRQEYQEDFSILIVDFTRDIFEKQSPNKIRDIITEMLYSEVEVLNRLAIHLINFFFDELKELFFTYQKGNILDNHALLHELYVLFKNQVDNFTEDEITFVLELIETQDFDYLREFSDEKNIEPRKIYRKRKYLYALKESKKYPQCLEQFNIYNSVLEHEDEHPAFDSYFSGFKRIESISPLSQNDMQEKSIDELIEYICNFKEPKNSRFYDNPKAEGLAKEFAKFISVNPKKYSSFLEKMALFGEEYFYEILDIYNSLLEENREIELIKIMKYINLSLENFINKKNIKKWYITSPIFDFIKIISSDKNSIIISEELHFMILDIFRKLQTLIENEREDENEITDYISHLLNSSFGDFYRGLIEYSLKYSRDNDLKQDRWITEIKEIFTKDLHLETSINIFTTIGLYIINIKYLDKDWLDNSLELIFTNKEFDKYREAFFTAYLHNLKVDFEIHNKISKLNVFTMALNNKSNSQYIERLIEYVIFFYISEDNPKSIIFQLLEKLDKEKLEYLINILSNKSLSDKQLRKIWKALLTQIEKQNYTDIYIHLLKLIPLISDIDSEYMNLINKSIEKINNLKFRTYWIVGTLLKSVEKNPKYIADIYIKLLKIDSFGEVYEEKVTEILEYFYQHNLKLEADKICNLYGEYGVDKWKNIYEKYN